MRALYVNHRTSVSRLVPSVCFTIYNSYNDLFECIPVGYFVHYINLNWLSVSRVCFSPWWVNVHCNLYLTGTWRRYGNCACLYKPTERDAQACKIEGHLTRLCCPQTAYLARPTLTRLHGGYGHFVLHQHALCIAAACSSRHCFIYSGRTSPVSYDLSVMKPLTMLPAVVLYDRRARHTCILSRTLSPVCLHAKCGELTHCVYIRCSAGVAMGCGRGHCPRQPASPRKERQSHPPRASDRNVKVRAGKVPSLRPSYSKAWATSKPTPRLCQRVCTPHPRSKGRVVVHVSAWAWMLTAVRPRCHYHYYSIYATHIFCCIRVRVEFRFPA